MLELAVVVIAGLGLVVAILALVARLGRGAPAPGPVAGSYLHVDSGGSTGSDDCASGSDGGDGGGCDGGGGGGD
jgi:hypothetical protein